MDDTIKKLHVGDPRCEQLLNAILEIVYDRGCMMPIPSILGVIDLVKIEIIKDMETR